MNRSTTAALARVVVERLTDDPPASSTAIWPTSLRSWATICWRSASSRDCSRAETRSASS